jgi:putative membrane protein
MRAHLIRFVINALALCLAVWLVPGLAYTGTPAGFLILAVVFGLVNAILRPLLMILTCPLVVITLGLFTLVINAILLMATGAVSRHLGLGFSVSGFSAALLGGILVGLASPVLALTIVDRAAG